MEVKLHGEMVGIHDDQTIRAHSTRHGILVLDALPNKNIKPAFRQMISDVYFLNVKFGALLAYLEAHEQETMDVQPFAQLVEALRMVLGTKATTQMDGDILEKSNESFGRRDGEAEGGGSGSGAGAAPEFDACGECPAGQHGQACCGGDGCSHCDERDRDTAASAIDGH